MKQEIQNLRDLAKRYMDICNAPSQEALKDLWRRHNSLEETRPLLWVMRVPYKEFFDYSVLKCTDPFFRGIETNLAHMVYYRCKLKDDNIFEPWVTMRAVPLHDMEYRWGVPCGLGEAPVEGGAAAFKKAIEGEEDLCRLHTEPYGFDEEKTRENYEKLHDALGDIIDIRVDRRGNYSRLWNADLSTDLGKLLSLEDLLYDLYDEPEFLHKLLSFMRDTVLADLDAYEQSGGACMADSYNQTMAFSKELGDPDCNVTGCKTSDMWAFFASQEFTCVGPDMFNEFMLEYQKPIMARYGQVAYGCCEDLTQKIDLLRTVPNLRRIGVTPFARVRECAEQIQDDYVLSWRPNPSTMIATCLDEDLVRKTMRENFRYFRENKSIFDITLKDVQTIHKSPEDVIRWTEIVRDEIDRY